LREGRSPVLLIPAAASLALSAWLLTLHPTAAGRFYAAYGAIYVSVALVWLRVVEGVPLTLRDLVESVVVLAGMWSGCGREYCLKVALEFNRTESRAQRHNYKKRLQEVGKTHPEWSKTAEEIADQFLN